MADSAVAEEWSERGAAKAEREPTQAQQRQIEQLMEEEQRLWRERAPLYRILEDRVAELKLLDQELIVLSGIESKNFNMKDVESQILCDREDLNIVIEALHSTSNDGKEDIAAKCRRLGLTRPTVISASIDMMKRCGQYVREPTLISARRAQIASRQSELADNLNKSPTARLLREYNSAIKRVEKEMRLLKLESDPSSDLDDKQPSYADLMERPFTHPFTHVSCEGDGMGSNQEHSHHLLEGEQPLPTPLEPSRRLLRRDENSAWTNLLDFVGKQLLWEKSRLTGWERLGGMWEWIGTKDIEFNIHKVALIEVGFVSPDSPRRESRPTFIRKRPPFVCDVRRPAPQQRTRPSEQALRAAEERERKKNKERRKAEDARPPQKARMLVGSRGPNFIHL
jgi:hypothetical protein